jgi:hypothetical protein
MGVLLSDRRIPHAVAAYTVGPSRTYVNRPLDGDHRPPFIRGPRAQVPAVGGDIVSPQAFEQSNKIVFWARSWLAGPALISAVPSYGKTGLIGRGWGFLVNAMWTGSCRGAQRAAAFQANG